MQKKVVAPPRPAGKKPAPRPTGQKKVKAPPRVPSKDGRRGSATSASASVELAEARTAAQAAREELETVKALLVEEKRVTQRAAAAAEEERTALATELAAAQRATVGLARIAAAERERDAAFAERDAAFAERGAAVAERDAAAAERGAAVAERDAAFAERGAAVAERDAVREELESIAALPPPAQTETFEEVQAIGKKQLSSNRKKTIQTETFEVPSDGEEDEVHSARAEGGAKLDVVGGFLDELATASRRGSADAYAPHFGAVHAGIAGAHPTTLAAAAESAQRDAMAEAAQKRDALCTQLDEARAAERTLATAHAEAIAALERERDHFLRDGRELHAQVSVLLSTVTFYAILLTF